jgi:hypothetical protein
MKMDLPQEYATNDLYLASYLKARGLKLATIERDGKRSRFVFHDEPNRGQMVTDYYNDLPFRISTFIHAMQDLKAAIHHWEGVQSARAVGLR